MASPLEHVMDEDTHWTIFKEIGLEIPLPNIMGFQITKFMLLEVIAAAIILALFIPLARRSRSDGPPKGPLWNALEAVLTFIRDQVAKPYIGEHDADRFVPFLWTLFLFLLVNNLLGMIPFMGSPTASLSVTWALAFCAFVVIHGSAIMKHGFVGYLQTYIPHLGMPMWQVFPIVILIAFIEVLSQFIKAGVLGIRLFANMFGGHTVLAVVLGFIAMAKNASFFAFWGVTFISVLGVTAISMLELFVAFLQAFIFTFLTSLFVGSMLHPEH